jgi:flagellar biosynthesis protein FlhF
MQTKRFVAADMTRALTLVRDEMGEDAMILSTQRTAKGVEIVAALEEPKTTIESEVSPQKTVSFDAVDTVPMQTQERGLASGKTKEELALELEVARRRMLAFQEQDNITLEQWAAKKAPVQESTVQESTVQKNPILESALQKPTQHSAASITSKNQKTTFNNSELTADQSQINQWLNEKRSPSRPKQQPQRTQENKPELDTQAIQELVEQQLERDNEEIRRLHDEIASMRNLFESQLSSLADAQERQYQAQLHEQKPVIHEVQSAMTDVRKRLAQLGLSRACNDRIVQSLNCFDGTLTSPEIIWAESLARLARQIPSITDDPVAKGGTYAFLGTTGVGKTTTIAKLAARYVMEHGAEKVAVLTTDTFRIAAHDQLRSLGRILNVQVKVVDDLKELPKILSAFRQQELVLIDTPGMGYNDPLLKQHLTALRKCKNLESALVLSANSQYQMMQASLHSYRIANPHFCVMTKLDECASLGDAISLLTTNNLPMAYVTNGQAVPDDLLVVKPQQLVTKAVDLSRTSLKVTQQAKERV